MRVLGCESNHSPKLQGKHQPRIHLLPHSFIPSLLPSLAGSSNSLWAFTHVSDAKLEIVGALVLPKPSLDITK